mgnify:CR=1 FL=1
MNRVFLTGDTHGDFTLRKLSSGVFSLGKALTKQDYVIILGDFGVIWKLQEDRQEIYLKKWLNEKPFTTLFIDGNHENHNRLKKLKEKTLFGGKVGVVSDSIFHLKRGEIYTIGSKKFLTIGGALSYDKNNRIEGLSWWPEEVLSYDEQENTLHNLEKHNNTVDYILAHTLPESKVLQFNLIGSGYSDLCSVRKFLDHVIEITKFEKFFCGHWHRDKTFDNYHLLFHNIIEIDT